MKKLFLNCAAGVLTTAFFCLVNVSAFAQTEAPAASPVAKPTATKPSTQLAPKILTPEQKQRLADAQNNLRLARSEAEAAKARLDSAQLFVEGLTIQFKLELKVDQDTYENDLQLIDQRNGVIGFVPKKPPESKPTKQ